MTTVNIAKLDAIRAQLDAAIELYFVSDNVVATHTLAAAAYNALRDIAKREGSEYPFLKTEFIDSLPEPERKRTIRFLNDPENFFKHADHDPRDEITFDTELTELLLTDACAYFLDKSIAKPKHYNVFKVWVGKTRDDIPRGSALWLFMEAFRGSFKAKGRREFWDFMHAHLTSRPTHTR